MIILQSSLTMAFQVKILKLCVGNTDWHEGVFFLVGKQIFFFNQNCCAMY